VSLLDPCQCTWNVKERAATEAAALSAYHCESFADKERRRNAILLGLRTSQAMVRRLEKVQRRTTKSGSTVTVSQKTGKPSGAKAECCVCMWLSIQSGFTFHAKTSQTKGSRCKFHVAIITIATHTLPQMQPTRTNIIIAGSSGICRFKGGVQK